MLYTLPSKNEACQELCRKLTGQTLIFGNDINTLLKVTPYCISSKNSPAKNSLILDEFQRGKFPVLASFKMLEQGANLNDLKNVVLLSYYGKNKAFIQRIGRLRQDGTVGNVFIFLTEGTQESVWFKNMTEGIDLETVYCTDVTDAIKKVTQ